jgi:hypothetical protein
MYDTNTQKIVQLVKGNDRLSLGDWGPWNDRTNRRFCARYALRYALDFVPGYSDYVSAVRDLVEAGVSPLRPELQEYIVQQLRLYVQQLKQLSK